MKEKSDKWIEEYVETPESFRNAVKQQVEEELKKDQVNTAINKTSKKRWQPVKVAIASLIFICLLGSGVYAFTKLLNPSALTWRPVDESAAEKYENYDEAAFNQTVTPGWPQTMINLFGEERAKKGVEEPAINITSVFYDGLTLTFYAKPTEFGKTCGLRAERLVVGDAIFMIQFEQLTAETAEVYGGAEAGDCVGRVELGGVVLPENFRAELVLDILTKGTQDVAFDVQLDENMIVKPKTSAVITEGACAAVDLMKITDSGTYIRVTWEFDENQKALYDQLGQKIQGDYEEYGRLFMTLEDDKGNIFNTEKDGYSAHSIVFYADGRSDWSGNHDYDLYEEDGKYYLTMNSIVAGMTEDVTSLTIQPFLRTGMEGQEEHEYTYYDFAEFTVNFD